MATIPSKGKDASLMETFCAVPGVTRVQLEKSNNVQLYLRVITIADLAYVKGTTICDERLNGE